MKLVWSPAALEDLQSAVDYIEFDLDSPMAAEKFFRSVLEKAQLFADVPGSGTSLKTIRGYDTGYHYMICENWMIFFEVANERALVVRILYGKSDYMRTLLGKTD